MKTINRKAFSLLEVLCAVALFTSTALVIVKCFMEHATTPKVDRTAVALIADIDNCMTHREELRAEKEVHCLFYPHLSFKATCEVKNVNTTLKLWTLKIKGYPDVHRETLAYLYEYVP